MIDFNFFLELSKYANANWKGSFTQDEVRENAETYFSDWIYSNEHGEPTETIKFLIDNLAEDAKVGIEKAREFLKMLGR